MRNRKRFVSRGSHKLQGGVDAFRTGRARFAVPGHRLVHRRFQRLPLAGGRASVACVDVNYGSWHGSCGARPARERVRAREHQASADQVKLGAPFRRAGGRPSFIGLAALHARVRATSSSRAPYSLGLVKLRFSRDPTKTEPVRDEGRAAALPVDRVRGAGGCRVRLYGLSWSRPSRRPEGTWSNLWCAPCSKGLAMTGAVVKGRS